LIVSCFFQAEDGIRDLTVTGVQTCALPIYFMNSSRINFDPNTDQGNKPSVEIFNMGFLGITETKLVYPFGTKATDGKGTVADSEIGRARVGKECRSRSSRSQ